MKTVENFELSTDIKTTYGNFHELNNRIQNKSTFTGMVKVEAQNEEIIKILYLANHRVNIYKKQVPKYAQFIVEDMAMIVSIVEVKLEINKIKSLL